MAKPGRGDSESTAGFGIGRQEFGSKHSVMSDTKDAPLAIVLSGANTHDVKLLAETLGGVVIVRPEDEG